MPTREHLRARVADLRAELDRIDGTLEPDGEDRMNDDQIASIARKIDLLADKIGQMAVVVARIEERSDSDRRDAAERSARVAALEAALRDAERRLDEEAGARQAADKFVSWVGGAGLLGALGSGGAWLLQLLGLLGG